MLVDEWVPRPKRPVRDEALGEWALRYFSGHGPATVKDFVWWTKLIAADVKTGLAVARPQLERIEVDGVEYFMHPGDSSPARLVPKPRAGGFPAPRNTCWATRIAERRCPPNSPSA